MWITYSCDGGRDVTSTHIPPRRHIPGGKCPGRQGQMRSRDIPLNQGWINIKCGGGGGGSRRVHRGLFGLFNTFVQVTGPRTAKGCITIHKVRAACNLGKPITGHMNLVGILNNKISTSVSPYKGF